jgi:hypothetical protein
MRNQKDGITNMWSDVWKVMTHSPALRRLEKEIDYLIVSSILQFMVIGNSIEGPFNTTFQRSRGNIPVRCECPFLLLGIPIVMHLIGPLTCELLNAKFLYSI